MIKKIPTYTKNHQVKWKIKFVMKERISMKKRKPRESETSKKTILILSELYFQPLNDVLICVEFISFHLQNCPLKNHQQRHNTKKYNFFLLLYSLRMMCNVWLWNDLWRRQRKRMNERTNSPRSRNIYFYIFAPLSHNTQKPIVDIYFSNLSLFCTNFKLQFK